ncbi:hypothetical protein GCM10009610_40100 [Pseudonocardia xinjiangensis]
MYREGDCHMVGNNTPVLLLRGPDGVPALHPVAEAPRDSNLRDHDMPWDIWTPSPESAPQVTRLMGDRRIPRTWRHMQAATGGRRRRFGRHGHPWSSRARAAFMRRSTTPRSVMPGSWRN